MLLREWEKDLTQRVMLTRWVVGVEGVGQETHPTCRNDTLGGRWVVVEGEWDPYAALLHP